MVHDGDRVKYCVFVRACACACVFDTASGIGSLVQPMVWYYQTTFSLPAGLTLLYIDHLATATPSSLA